MTSKLNRGMILIRLGFFGGGREMKIKKSNFWTVCSKLFGLAGIGIGVVFGVSVLWMKLLGYEPRIPTAFTTEGAVYSSVAVQRQQSPTISTPYLRSHNQ